MWSQLIALPVGNTLCATLGIFGASAIHAGWGQLIWYVTPIDSHQSFRGWIFVASEET